MLLSILSFSLMLMMLLSFHYFLHWCFLYFLSPSYVIADAVAIIFSRYAFMIFSSLLLCFSFFADTLLIISLFFMPAAPCWCLLSLLILRFRWCHIIFAFAMLWFRCRDFLRCRRCRFLLLLPFDAAFIIDAFDIDVIFCCFRFAICWLFLLRYCFSDAMLFRFRHVTCFRFHFRYY